MNPDFRIGWLGTGRLGSALAARMISSGVAVTVWNRTASKTAPLVDLGASHAETLSGLGHCDIVFVTVMSSPDLLAVTVGPDGLLSSQPALRIIVNCSTVSAEAAAEVRSQAARHKVGFLSAPVSGNPDAVANGHGSIVASGPAEVFDAARPYLGAIASGVTYAGAGEEALLVKLAHNLLVGMSTEALAEATTLAEKGGVAPSVFLDFIDGSVLGSKLFSAKGQAIRARDYEPTFTTAGMRKDFDLGLAAARALEVPMPIAASTHQLVQTAIGHGYGEYDYVALYAMATRGAALPDERPSATTPPTDS
ncbi:NAD(P)-dependent oxidoreductase [uncultured Mycobacterium sp.]|uniref:NAD(P)-dependent oxidoreductase n=1 Tax=uncultured Mycobacterium sp. TaxID=171292 RepID=UPI0035C95331